MDRSATLKCFLLNPEKPALVSGGNLETSQRIVDTVLIALSKIDFLRTPAAGCGTMINVMIGGLSEKGFWAFYETIGGGSGGRFGKNGVSGVHVNMTNTLNTPVEVAERNYPLIYTIYGLREGSGGDGLVKGFVVKNSVVLSILSDKFNIDLMAYSEGSLVLQQELSSRKAVWNT